MIYFFNLSTPFTHFSTPPTFPLLIATSLFSISVSLVFVYLFLGFGV